MNLRKILITAGIAAMFMFMVPAGQVLAGGDPPTADLTQGTIQEEPVYWGVIIMDCPVSGDAYATLRAKRIKNCDVETTAAAGYSFNCPNDESGIPDNAMLTGLQLFTDDPANSTPVITNVKNFVRETKGNKDLVSFDAQIKFYIPNP